MKQIFVAIVVILSTSPSFAACRGEVLSPIPIKTLGDLAAHIQDETGCNVVIGKELGNKELTPLANKDSVKNILTKVAEQVGAKIEETTSTFVLIPKEKELKLKKTGRLVSVELREALPSAVNIVLKRLGSKDEMPGSAKVNAKLYDVPLDDLVTLLSLSQ